MADPVIPQRTAIRGRVPGTYDPMRRPGSSGQRYFSDIEYVTNVDSPAAQTAANLAAQGRRNEQAAGLQALNLSNLARQQRPATFLPPAEEAGIATVEANQTTGAQRVYDLLQQLTQGAQQRPYGTGIASGMGADTTGASYTFPSEIQRGVGMIGVGNAVEQLGYRNPKDYFQMGLAPEDIVSRGLGGFTSEQLGSRPYDLLVGEYKNYLDVQEAHRLGGEKSLAAAQGMAQGGLASVAPKGMYLGGSTDGMADQIPATINNQQPAALSDGEFVIPADVVSHLGNGNSDAGAKQLYGMMDRIRKARTGSTEQGKQINPNKFLA